MLRGLTLARLGQLTRTPRERRADPGRQRLLLVSEP